MRFRRVLAVTFTLGLLDTACVLPGFPQSAVETKPEGQSPILQLDQPVRFLNSDGLPLKIVSGTYQITRLSPDMLQLTSTSTEKAQNLHTTTITNTESLTAPYPILIQEAKGQEHKHIALLLPDGQGLNAENLGQEVLSRGADNPPRSLFIPTRRYRGLIIQKGRVST